MILNKLTNELNSINGEITQLLKKRNEIEHYIKINTVKSNKIDTIHQEDSINTIKPRSEEAQ